MMDGKYYELIVRYCVWGVKVCVGDMRRQEIKIGIYSGSSSMTTVSMKFLWARKRG
jgi:hypothetical protein